MTDECSDCLKIMAERDRYFEWADRLAYGIAKILGEEIGEHTSENYPWDNAMSLLETACLLPGKPPTDETVKE